MQGKDISTYSDTAYIGPSEKHYVVFRCLCKILHLSLGCLSLVGKKLNYAKARVQSPFLLVFAFRDSHCQDDKWTLTEARVIQGSSTGIIVVNRFFLKSIWKRKNIHRKCIVLIHCEAVIFPNTKTHHLSAAVWLKFILTHLYVHVCLFIYKQRIFIFLSIWKKISYSPRKKIGRKWVFWKVIFYKLSTVKYIFHRSL